MTTIPCERAMHDTSVDDPTALVLRALTSQDAGRWMDAIDGFADALALDPRMLELRLLLAYAQGNGARAGVGRREAAIATLDATPGVSELSARDARTLADAAIELHANRCARRALERALMFAPADADLLASYGAVLHRLGHLTDAAAQFARALSQAPSHVPALMSAAHLDATLGMSARAIARYDAVLRTHPDHARARSSRGLLRLATGDHAGGWRDYEARRTQAFHTVIAPKGIPAWDGGDPRGSTVLLWGEQGLGDQIMGVRFATRLADAGARVVVRCHPSLVRLFRTVDGVSEVFAADDIGADSVLRSVDTHVPMLSVPHLLGVTSDADYGSDSYLSAVPGAHSPLGHTERPCAERVDAIAGDPHRPRVAVVWAGSSAHGNDANRSLPAAVLRMLLRAENVSWISLQLGARANDLQTLSPAIRSRVHDMGIALSDFAATAAILAQCDALVTVDTAVAHLGGAMGVRTVVMVPAVADWRWQEERSDSPWYGSVTLVRQRTPGDWDRVVKDVHARLG